MSLGLDAVIPVFLLAGLGYLLHRIGFIKAEFSRGLNQLVYWIGLPSLLFHKIAHQQLNWSSVAHVLGAFFLALIFTIFLSYLLARLWKIDDRSAGAFVQASYRGNLGFIGLPIVLYSATPATVERASSLAALSLAPCAIAFNIIAVLIMIRHQPDSSEYRPRYFHSLFSNPLIIGGLLGIFAALFQWQIPTAVDRSIEGLSNMSVPIALLGLGSSIGVFGFREIDREFLMAALGATLLKILFSPLLGVFCALLMGLDFVEARIVAVFLATPTAIASHVIVGQFRGDEKLAASSIMTATIGSVFFIPLALWITDESIWNALQNAI